MSSSVQIYQWNVLAQSLADETGFPHVNPQYLTWSHRWSLIKVRLGVIVKNNGILVMEEVDPEMYKCFNEFFDANDYNCDWVSKNMPDKNQRDGTLIAWPTEYYDTKYHNGTAHALGDHSTQNAFRIDFVCKTTQQNFVVCGVHLKAKPPFAKKRAKQIKICLDLFESHENVLLVGDFNDTPDSECVKKCIEAGFTSAYGIDEVGIDEVGIDEVGIDKYTPTTAKIRKNLVIRCIDYIWFRGPCWNKVKSVRELEQMSEFVPNYLPHKNHPSDHLMLGMKIEIKSPL